MDSPKFSAFNIYTTPYKTIDSQDIDLHVFVPKDAKPGPRPVILHLHGGFLISGHALHAPWVAPWVVDYQLLHSAIKVSANYRLLPESTGLDILSDIRDVLTWVEKSLASYLQSVGNNVTSDLTKLLVYGESAGGYLAIQSSLMRPDIIKATIAAYPMTYLDEDWWAVASTSKSPFGAPQMPMTIIDNHLAAMEAGKIVSGAFPPERLELAMAITQHGLYPQVMGTDESLFPAKLMGKISGKRRMPYLFVFHGKEDSAVPCAHSEKFVRLWADKFGKERVIGKYETGDHGFDNDTDISLDTVWMKDGLSGVTQDWLA